MPSSSRPTAATPGYSKGRLRREQIVAAATDVYTEAGYDGASLREIAKRVGITHQTLTYHFPTHEALLAAVLERRDEVDLARSRPHGPTGLAGLWQSLEMAEHNQRHPGIVELYARLAAEAITPGHPAHDYFLHHYALARDALHTAFAALADAGHLRDGVDPRTAALTYIALMDGLQVQWLTDPDRIDLVGPLRFFLHQVLTVPLD